MMEVANLLDRLDRWLGTRTIPVERFGYECLGHGAQDFFGYRCAFGRWHFPEAERDRFFRHNRDLESLRIFVRKLALRVRRRIKTGDYK